MTRMTCIVNDKKQLQGQTDSNCIWAKCRFRFAAQILMRIGKDLGEHLDLLQEECGEFPACFDLKLLPKLDHHAIGYWDMSRPYSTQ